MDRRSTLRTLLGRAKPIFTPENTQKTQITASAGLTPYAGDWTALQATHLLRRVTFGPTKTQIQDAVNNGLDATIAEILAPAPALAPPVNYDESDDPRVPIGSTWVDADYANRALNGYRRRSLYAWQMEVLRNAGINIAEKMTLFWHNHFVIEGINDPKFVYHYIKSLRDNSLGNFKELVKMMTINPAMLRYLNGNQNTKRSPNENYARELLELFSIGKGPQVGSGDYTNYTEEDILEISKILTGWIDTGWFSNNGQQIGAMFRENQHDTSDKTLSARFNNAVIRNNGEQEYSDLIDVIFQQEEVARFIVRKFYRYFIYYNIDEDIEQNIIEPLAQQMIAADFEIKPVIETLLKSEHFFQVGCIGCMIKNPIDFAIGILRQFDVSPIQNDLDVRYTTWLRIFYSIRDMQMGYFLPPNVAGWKAYYQQPQYYRTWIGSATLVARSNFAKRMVTYGYNISGNRTEVDVLGYLETLEMPSDVNMMIDELTELFLPQPISDEQKVYLKEALIQQLPDYEWTEEYIGYLDNPTDNRIVRSIQTKVERFFTALLNMAEHQLS